MHFDKTGFSAGFVILLLKADSAIFINFDIMAQKEQDGRKWKVAVFVDSWQNNKEWQF